MGSSKQSNPSSRWTSYEGWNWGGMKERLEGFLLEINRDAFVEHVLAITRKASIVCKPFSAGQYWCCLELIAEDGTLFIARLRLPDHPEASLNIDASQRIEGEIATMR
jgi:hypothetical protein